MTIAGRAYSRDLDRFLTWYANMGSVELSRAVLRKYRAWLEGRLSATSSVNQELSALPLVRDLNAARQHLQISIDPIRIQSEPKFQRSTFADLRDVHKTEVLLFDVGLMRSIVAAISRDIPSIASVRPFRLQ